MKLASPLDQAPRKRARIGNFWPLAGAALCLAFWWPIITALFGAHAANAVVASVACLFVIALAQALRLGALRAGYEPVRLPAREDVGSSPH